MASGAGCGLARRSSGWKETEPEWGLDRAIRKEDGSPLPSCSFELRWIRSSITSPIAPRSNPSPSALQILTAVFRSRDLGSLPLLVRGNRWVVQRQKALKLIGQQLTLFR